jgi:hypothetical protein
LARTFVALGGERRAQRALRSDFTNPLPDSAAELRAASAAPPSAVVAPLPTAVGIGSQQAEIVMPGPRIAADFIATGGTTWTPIDSMV